MSQDRRDAGFTLIEVIVSLVLFALIAMAGVAMVDGVLRVQGETTGRLDRLAAIQRAMFVVSNDLEQISAGPVEGTPTHLAFTRPLAARGGSTGPIAFGFADSTIDRAIGSDRHQHLLDGVAGVRWHYFAAGVWSDHWPPDPKQAGDRPEAVSLEIALKPAPNQPGGTLHRVIALPMQP